MKVWRLLALCGAVLFLIGGVGAISAQEGPNRDLLVKAVLYLAERLGTPISQVDTYTYEAANYPDSALGCPAQGKTYTPGPFPSWKLLLTIKDITYDVRITTDGAVIVVCAAIVNTFAPPPTVEGVQATLPVTAPAATPIPTLPPPPTAIPPTAQIGLAVYRGVGYSLPYPNIWDITDRTVDIYFGVGNSPRCDGPGMTITPLGPTQGQTPDMLIDAYLKSLGRAEVVSERSDVRRLGRTVRFIAPCANGTPRLHQLTVFAAYGQGFRVVQFAPQADFGLWAGKFGEILDQFAPSTVGGGEGVAIQRPASAPLALIAHIFSGNIYRGTLIDLPGFPVTSGGTESRPYRNVTVSPNGAFIAFVDPNARSLIVASTVGGPLRPLAEGLAVNFPPAWSPDSGQVAFMGEADGQLSLKAVKLSSGDIVTLATVGPVAECPALATERSERLYETETGSGGNRVALWWADQTVYHTSGCGVGLYAVAPGGSASVEVAPTLRRITPSPDGRRAAALDGDRLVVVDLASQRITMLTPAAQPDQLGWSSDGSSLFYAAITPQAPQTLDSADDAERGKLAFGVWPYTLQTYTVSLRRLDLSSGADAEFWSAEGRGVGRFAASPDGSGLLFSFVQAPRPLVEAFLNNVSPGELKRQAPNVQLYWIAYPLGGTPLLVAVTTGAVWGGIGSAAAPTPTGGGGPGVRATPTLRRTATPIRLTATPTPEEVPPTLPPSDPGNPGGALPTNTPRPTRTP